MNNLNSVLIEGTVSGGFCADKTQKVARCSFVLSCVRNQAAIHVRVETSRPVLVKAAAVSARDGCGVRVVGILAEDGDGLYLEAEHIEYRGPAKGGRNEQEE
jgi:hypothetical protein